MGYKMKGFSGFGNSPAKQKTAIEAIKEVDSSTTGYSNQDKSKMRSEREIYKAKLRGDFIDLRGKSEKEQKEMLKKHGITEPEWHKKRSPTKETQGISGDQVLINAQKELSGEEMSYKAPGWARMATSILPGHDPTGQSKGGKKAKASGGAAGGGGVVGGMDEIKAGAEKYKEIKNYDWKGAFTK